MTRRVLAEQRGETITSLLVALAIGSVVLWAAIQLLVGSMASSARATDRAESVQRARLALDRVTTVLGSQVCLGTTQPPVQEATATAVTVIADLGDERFAPDLHRFSLDPATQALVEDITPGSGTPPNTTFTGTPQRRVLAGAVTARASEPLFRYYAFDPVLGSQRLVELPAPLSAADRARVVRITIALLVRPLRTGHDDPRATTLDAGAGPASMEPTLEWQTGPRCA